MISHHIGRRSLAGWFALVATGWLSFAAAELVAVTYKPGDRVEAKNGSEWKAGTVVEVNERSGRLKVRLDDINLPEQVPEQFRERMSTRSFSADNVRPARAKTAAKAAMNIVEKVAEKTSEPAPSRKWSDRTGKFSVDARFDSLNGDRVVLVKAE